MASADDNRAHVHLISPTDHAITAGSSVGLTEVWPGQVKMASWATLMAGLVLLAAPPVTPRPVSQACVPLQTTLDKAQVCPQSKFPEHQAKLLAVSCETGTEGSLIVRALANDLWSSCAADCLFTAKDASQAWSWRESEGCWSAKRHACLFTEEHHSVISKWKKICVQGTGATNSCSQSHRLIPCILIHLCHLPIHPRLLTGPFV